MQVIVDPRSRTVALVDPNDTKRFDVVVIAESPNDDILATVDEVLRGEGVGRIEQVIGDEPRAAIDPEVVKKMAEPHVAAGWLPQFQTMLDFAATKGWIDPDNGDVRAHMIWGPPT